MVLCAMRYSAWTPARDPVMELHGECLPRCANRLRVLADAVVRDLVAAEPDPNDAWPQSQ